MSKIIRLGIIGAENSHSYKIADICNIKQLLPLRVTHIWGETDELAKEAAEKGAIPTIVSDWKEMTSKVDGIMIDHRHGAEHAEVAMHFLERGMPVFVDKPITCRLEEAKQLFAVAEKHRAPLFTFSSKALQDCFQKQALSIGRESVLAFHSTGPSDLSSPWGGIFFYGIHQVDCAVEVLGTDAIDVHLHQSGKNAVASIAFPEGRMATLNLIASHPVEFHWTFCTDGRTSSLNDTPDAVPYLKSARYLYDFMSTGRSPFSMKRMLAPIAILEALEKSHHSGCPVQVAKF